MPDRPRDTLGDMNRAFLRRPWVLFSLVVAVASSCGKAQEDPRKLLHKSKSEFNTIYVYDTSDGTRVLAFEEDGAMQSAMDLKDPNRLVLSYARTSMAVLPLVDGDPKRILIVGLGGATMPTFLRKVFPDAIIECAELDPGVVDVAKKFFNYVEDGTKSIVHVGDGRKFIETTKEKYDLIFLDAYGPDSVPYTLATKQFLEAVKSRLTENGICVSNLWGSELNKLYASMILTHEAVFPEVRIIKAPLSSNRVVLAFPQKRGVTKQDWAKRAAEFGKRKKFAYDLSTLVEHEEARPRMEGAKVLLDGEEPKG
jgi:spermidine synthase